MERIVILDGNSLLHRAYHALPPMNDGKGRPTNAVFGFLSMLLKIIEQYAPDYMLAAFDTPAKTPRHIAYPEYKGTRKPADDELRAQFPIIKETLGALGVTVGEKDGLEADDFLGIYSKMAEKAGINALLVTGDKDSLQLVSDATTVVLTKKGISETLDVTPGVLMELYGLTPERMIDLKALMGDSSDNIPGVPGVGEKTALKLLAEYKTLDGVLDNAQNVKGKLGEKLAANKETAYLSRRLVTIVREAEVPFTIEECRFNSGNMAWGKPVLLEYGLRNIASRINGTPQRKPEQPGLSGQTAAEPEKARELEIIDATEKKALAAAEKEWEKAGKLAVLEKDGWGVSDGSSVWLLGSGDMLEPLPSAVKALLASDKAKLLWDSKALMHNSEALGGGNFDALLAAYLLHPSQSAYSLETLAEEYLGATSGGAGELYAVCGRLGQALREQGMGELFYNIEQPLAYTLCDMEREGFMVDTSILRGIGGELESDIARLETGIHRLAGDDGFNINSTQQLGAILFEKLGLPSGKKTKTGYSTDAGTLEGIADRHEIIPAILEYRKLAKLKSTYIEALIKLAGADGRIHTEFKQTVTATGRISSAEPNLQNIPIRTARGREIRKAFVAKEGCTLIDADYSQIELRVLAHLAQDEAMIDSFNKGEDIHARTAKEVFGTEEKRAYAKAVNFGIVYGISDFGLAQQLGVTRTQAKEYIEAYLARYTGIKNYMEKVIAGGTRDGYVTTLFGRRREMPELKSKNFNVRSFGKRAAMNAPVQGTAADIIKIAMVRVHDELKKRGLGSKLILQVHDELIVEAENGEAEQVKALVKDCMENVVKLAVPLTADVSSGKSWYDAK